MIDKDGGVVAWVDVLGTRVRVRDLRCVAEVLGTRLTASLPEDVPCISKESLSALGRQCRSNLCKERVDRLKMIRDPLHVEAGHERLEGWRLASDGEYSVQLSP